MKEYSKIVFTVLIALVVGILIGMLIKNPKDTNRAGMHMMPDGTMMQNSGADMHGMMMDMTARMKGKTGDELDRVFLEDMIVHHEGAVEMAKILAAKTARPELQKMASDIITVQTAEISMMRSWLKEWFGK